MSDKYILDEQGNPVPCEDLYKWGRWLEGDENRILKHDYILSKRILVSTVFLGVDHNFGDDGPPVLWETMIFGGKHNDYQDRYTSKENALIGHQLALAMAESSKWSYWWYVLKEMPRKIKYWYWEKKFRKQRKL